MVLFKESNDALSNPSKKYILDLESSKKEVI